MNQTTCKELAQAIVTLVKKLNAGNRVALAAAGDGIARCLMDQGLTSVSLEEADVCVCVCTDLPEQAQTRRLPVILVERNGSNKEYLTQLLAGNIALFRHRVTTEKELTEAAFRRNYRLCGQADLHGVPDDAQITEGFGAKGNTVHKYLDWCKSTVDACADVSWFVRAFRYDADVVPAAAATPEPVGKRPFLSVLTRTQGVREAGLTEVLLCLAAQTDRDFELLIVGHKLNEQQKEMVLRLIDETPAYLRERIRFDPCNEDGRTAPLNHGFAVARGEYVSILDDDDIVMDNWVEEFHKAAKQAPGAILHAYCVKQDWTYIPQIRGSGEDLRSTSGYSRLYCRPYQLRKQFIRNFCPTLCLAYPVSICQQWNFTFDPSLNVTEDWDFLMRSSVLCGVQNTAAVTSIYRWWTNGVTSATLHRKHEWNDTYKLLTKRFSKMQMILPVKSVYGLEALQDTGNVLRLLPCVEGTFSESEALATNNLEEGALFCFEFKDLPDKKFGGLLRLDPFTHTNVFLSNCDIHVTFHNGETAKYTICDLTSNGWWIDDGIAFVDSAPQLYLRLPSGCFAKQIEIQFQAPAALDAEPALRIGSAFGCSSAELTVRSALYQGPVPAQIDCYGNHLTLEYDLHDLGALEELVFSPCKRGSVIIQDMKITATSLDGQEIPVRMKHNGFHRPNAAIFLRKPVYTIHAPGEVAHLSIDFRLDGEISEGAALSIHDPIRYIRKKLLKH